MDLVGFRFSDDQLFQRFKMMRQNMIQNFEKAKDQEAIIKNFLMKNMNLGTDTKKPGKS